MGVVSFLVGGGLACGGEVLLGHWQRVVGSCALEPRFRPLEVCPAMSSFMGYYAGSTFVLLEHKRDYEYCKFCGILYYG